MRVLTLQEQILELQRRERLLILRAANEIAAWGFLTPCAELDQKFARRVRAEAERLAEVRDSAYTAAESWPETSAAGAPNTAHTSTVSSTGS